MKDVEVIKARNTLSPRARTKVEKRLRVAAYCRVSTDTEDQLNSYKSQVEYYTELIKSKPEWPLAGIYADEAITGTQVKKREDFQRLINDCMNGDVDMVITKSISRFARNTLDTLKYVRMLKDKGVAVFFEEENVRHPYYGRRTAPCDFKFCCTAGSRKYFCECQKGLEDENAAR